MDDNFYNQLFHEEDERKIFDYPFSWRDCANSSGTFLLTNDHGTVELLAVKDKKFKEVSVSGRRYIYDYEKAAKMCPESSAMILDRFFINDNTFCLFVQEKPQTRQFFKINEKKPWEPIETLSDEEGMALLQANKENPFTDKKVNNNIVRSLREDNNLKFSEKYNSSDVFRNLASMIGNHMKYIEGPVEEDNFFGSRMDVIDVKAGKKITQYYDFAHKFLKKALDGTIDVPEKNLKYLAYICNAYCRDVNGDYTSLGRDTVSFIKRKSDDFKRDENMGICHDDLLQKLGKDVATKRQQQQIMNAQTFQR